MFQGSFASIIWITTLIFPSRWGLHSRSYVMEQPKGRLTALFNLRIKRSNSLRLFHDMSIDGGRHYQDHFFTPTEEIQIEYHNFIQKDVLQMMTNPCKKNKWTGREGVPWSVTPHLKLNFLRKLDFGVTIYGTASRWADPTLDSGKG